MPGSLLNLSRKVKRHDSTRSDISTYSNDSKKKVSFNKAVRVKKYTKSEDGDKNSEGKKFWFKVYKDIDPDVWEEYSGDDEKYHSDDKLKTIDESSAVTYVPEKPVRKNNVQQIINKFNEESLNREEDGAVANDVLSKYNKKYILNGMKAFFNSASLRNKKKNDSLKERNLENLFLNESYDSCIPNNYSQRNDLKIDKIVENWSPEKYEGNLRNYGEHRKSNSVVDIKKWDSGDELIFDTRQCEKAVEKSDKGQLTKIVEERDQVWRNINRSITYAESSPKIIKKRPEENLQPNEINSNYIKKTSYSQTNATRKDKAVHCNKKAVPESKIKSSDKYKVIRSKNGIASAYSNTALLNKDKPKLNRTSFNVNSICRPSVCSRDHDKNSHKNIENKLKKESNLGQKFKQEDKISNDSSRDSSPYYKSEASDYRRGYSTLRNSRRGSRNRIKSKDAASNISSVKITVNGEVIENQSSRGGLATAFNNRQRARNLSASPIRSGSGSDNESTHQHKTVILYIPGISHQQRRADVDEESGSTIIRSQSIKGKRPVKYRYCGSKVKEQIDFNSPDDLPDNRRFT